MDYKIECPVCSTVYKTELNTPKQELTRSSKMTFVKIKPGTFIMGERDNTKKVEITKSFEIGKTAVTQAQWTKVMGSNPSYFKDKPNNPVETVSWDDVQEFISKLNKSQRKYKYRLPTEAEWEYCCRAGTKTKYSFGDDESKIDDHAYFYKNSDNTTQPTGRLKSNPWGLYDMHGNVWEWTQDWYGNLKGGKDPQGPKKSSYRVLRGGSWSHDAQFLRSAYRDFVNPDYSYSNIGFRLVRTLAVNT